MKGGLAHSSLTADGLQTMTQNDLRLKELATRIARKRLLGEESFVKAVVDILKEAGVVLPEKPQVRQRDRQAESDYLMVRGW